MDYLLLYVVVTNKVGYPVLNCVVNDALPRQRRRNVSLRRRVRGGNWGGGESHILYLVSVQLLLRMGIKRIATSSTSRVFKRRISEISCG